MSTIEERVLAMKFDSAAFERGVSGSLRTLETLNKALQLQGAAKGLNGISTAASAQTGALQRVEAGVQSIADRFKTMSVVAISALATVTSQAVMAGGRLVKSLTLDPVISGFKEYETQIGAIQTILANTAHEGTNLKQVNAALNELNEYSDKTIYNFTEMAKNIGTFTAAGVSLKDSTAAIKGIANLAAVSGSNSQQASAAMYQLSQALAAGKVSLEDWNSVVNAGMGGKVFQDALMETARVHGVAIDQMVKDEGSFRLTLQNGWLTGEILNETLMKFTGDLNAAQLKSMGYNEKQIADILRMGKVATNAATEVKTMSQLISTLQEAVGSGWAKTWQLLFGDFTEAKGMFTEVSNVLGAVVKNSADSRNKLLSDWRAMGGRTMLITGISTAFHALESAIRPIAQAWRQAFPAVTAQRLVDMSRSFRDFAAQLKIGKGTAENLRRTFAGLFAVLGIGWDIFKQVVSTIARLAGVVFDGSGGFLEFTARVGDFLVVLRKTIQDGKGVQNVFKGIGDVLAVPIEVIKIIGRALGKLFKDVDAGKILDAVKAISGMLEPLGNMEGGLAKFTAMFDGALNGLMGKLRELGAWTAKVFGQVSKFFSKFADGINFDTLFKGINTGLLAGLFLTIRNFLKNGPGGIFDGISDSIEKFTGVLGSMQTTLRATTLLQIAVAVGILALAMDKLSKIDAGGLTRASIAMAGAFTQLLAAMLIFEKLSGFTGFAKMPFIAASMILLAAAVNILATAVVKLSSLDWNGLAKGLTGVTVLLGVLVASMNLMPNSGKLILSAAAVVIMAAAIKTLAGAVESLGEMSWEDMARGLTGVGVLIAALSVFANTTSLNVKGFISGVVIALLAASIKTLADAIKDMSGLDWMEMARGLTGIAAALTIFSGALKLLPPSTLLSAAAIFVVASSLKMINEALGMAGGMSWEAIGKGMVVLAGSLVIIAGALYLMEAALPGAAALLVVAASLGPMADALSQMGDMGWEAIAKGLVTLAGALLIIAGGLALMEASLPGAAALIVVAAALRILAPVLEMLGGLSWEAIAKGLAALAGVFVVLGIAGVALAPVLPTLFGLAAALLALGAAMLVAGAGVALFGAGIALLAAGLATLAVSGVAGTTALVGMMSVVLGSVPQIIKLVAAMLVALTQAIIQTAPRVAQAITVVILALLRSAEQITPKLIPLILKTLTLLIQKMSTYVPRMADAGMRLLTGLLNAIASRLGSVIQAATNVAVAFINGVAKNQGRVIDAGVKLIIGFVNGVANAIRSNSAAMNAAGRNLGSAIIEGMVGGISGGIGAITSAARRIASSALSSAKSVLGIHSPSREFEKIGKYVNDGFRKGLDGNRGQVDSAFNKLRDDLKKNMQESGKDVDSLEKKLRRLTHARRKDREEIAETKKELARARKEHAAFTAAYNELIKKQTIHKVQLAALADKQAAIAAKLKTANEKLADAIKTRDDYNKQIKDQYDNLPETTGQVSLAQYVAELRKDIEDTKKFASALQALRKLGLNDALYKELLSKGPEAMPFVQDLLAAGKNGVDEVNKLGKNLDKVAGDLGSVASKNLYQAAVNSAQGIVDGLKKQQKAIEAQMDKIADAMVKAIKKKLKIKSPSRVFAEVGKFSGEGLAKGLEESASLVNMSAAKVGTNAVEALRKTLASASKMTISEIDTQPVIKPVLDLTQLKQDATQLGSIFQANAIATGGSLAQARAAYEQFKLTHGGNSPVDEETGPVKAFSFTQNNYSPKALSNAEIYRQTKNQLSVAKGALATSANTSTTAK